MSTDRINFWTNSCRTRKKSWASQGVVRKWTALLYHCSLIKLKQNKKKQTEMHVFIFPLLRYVSSSLWHLPSHTPWQKVRLFLAFGPHVVIIPGYVLRAHSCSAQGTVCSATIKSRQAIGKTSTLIPVLSLFCPTYFNLGKGEGVK